MKKAGRLGISFVQLINLVLTTNGTKYSRMDQVKFVEDSF